MMRIFIGISLLMLFFSSVVVQRAIAQQDSIDVRELNKMLRNQEVPIDVREELFLPTENPSYQVYPPDQPAPPPPPPPVNFQYPPHYYAPQNGQQTDFLDEPEEFRPKRHTGAFFSYSNKGPATALLKTADTSAVAGYFKERAFAGVVTLDFPLSLIDEDFKQSFTRIGGGIRYTSLSLRSGYSLQSNEYENTLVSIVFNTQIGKYFYDYEKMRIYGAGGFSGDFVISSGRQSVGGVCLTSFRNTLGLNIVATIGIFYPYADQSALVVSFDWVMFKGLALTAGMLF